MIHAALPDEFPFALLKKRTRKSLTIYIHLLHTRAIFNLGGIAKW